MADSTDRIIEASVGLFVLAAVGMAALTQLFTAKTTSIPATVVTLVTTLVAILFSVAVALMFYEYRKRGRRGIARVALVPSTSNNEMKRHNKALARVLFLPLRFGKSKE